MAKCSTKSEFFYAKMVSEIRARGSIMGLGQVHCDGVNCRYGLEVAEMDLR